MARPERGESVPVSDGKLRVRQACGGARKLTGTRFVPPGGLQRCRTRWFRAESQAASCWREYDTQQVSKEERVAGTAAEQMAASTTDCITHTDVPGSGSGK